MWPPISSLGNDVNKANLGDAVRELVAAWLAWHESIDRRARVSELESRVEGFRVVDGGQVDANGAWEITDAASGEVLATGPDLATYGAAWQDSWIHADDISVNAHHLAHEPKGDFGLPVGMAKALIAWVVDQPDEARQVIAT